MLHHRSLEAPKTVEVDDRNKNLKDATAQELNLELIRRVHFGDCNGERIVDDLRNNRNLWSSVIMDSLSALGQRYKFSLIKLRDLEAGVWNVDTIFIMTNEENVHRLDSIARTWNPGYIAWLTVEEMMRLLCQSCSGIPPYCILQLWWDGAP